MRDASRNITTINKAPTTLRAIPFARVIIESPLHAFGQRNSCQYSHGHTLLHQRGNISRSCLKSDPLGFGDPVITIAVLDRPLHPATTVDIRAYRLKQKRCTPLLQPDATLEPAA